MASLSIKAPVEEKKEEKASEKKEDTMDILQESSDAKAEKNRKKRER